MIDYMLRFDSEQAMLDVIINQSMVSIDEDNNIIPILGTQQYALDIIGTIPPDTGFCVNLRIIDEAFDTLAFEPYSVNPKKPYRIWF
jgi:hypothetical protein